MIDQVSCPYKAKTEIIVLYIQQNSLEDVWEKTAHEAY
jgi:hypothetical protein